jgi:hypothetical protein
MAQRFGGKFSPSGTTQTGHDGPMVTRRAGRGPMKLYVLTPLPFALRAFTSPPGGLVLGLAGAAVLALAVWLTFEGQKAQAAYDERRVSRRPALPRKLLASGLTGLGVFLGCQMAGIGVAAGLGLTLAAVLLHAVTFGPDPLRDKGMEGVDTFQTDRVARAVDEAEAYLAGMKDAGLRANDRAIEARIEKFATTARALFRGIEGDPGDLSAARKYLTVYLMGARDATVKFVDLYARTRDAGTRADYEALLTDLETNFADRTKALLSDNRSDLDVEISVLRERLQREG